MKKLLTFLTLLTLFFGVGWAADETVIFSEQGYSNQQEITSYSGTNFTITFDKGTNNTAPKYYTNGSSLRIYGGNTFTFSSSTKNISEIHLTFGNSDGSNEITTNVGKCAIATNGYFWQGISSSVTFTVGGTSGNRRLSKVEVTYTTGGSETTLGNPSISFSSFQEGSESIITTITPDDNATKTYYKIGENGNYAEYSKPVSIDLTQIASPITVYAYSTNGTTTTDPVSQQYTVPALSVSISPMSYEGYGPVEVKVAPTNYVGVCHRYYKINDGNQLQYTAPFTLTEPGVYTIIGYADDERVGHTKIATESATITIIESPIYGLDFYESFAKAAGTGPTDGDWSGSIASSAFTCDNPGWSYSSAYSGDQCARFGKSSENGYATTPRITGFTAGEEYTLTFKAGAWNNDGTTLNLTASNGTFKDTEGNTITSVTMLNNAWKDYEVIFVPSATTSTITFASDNKRFFLDEVRISAPIPEGDYYLVGDFNNWTQQDPDYKFTLDTNGNYYLNGVNLNAYSKFKLMKGSTWCGGGTGDNQYNVTSNWHTDMDITAGDGGKNYYMSQGGTCYLTISSDNKLTVQKDPVVIRGSFDNWSDGVTMTTTEDGWTVSLTDAFAEFVEFGFVDGWGQWHGGNGTSIKEEFLGTALDMGTNGNYVVKVPGKYTIFVNRTLTKMLADVARESHNITTVANPNGGGSVSATVNGSTATSAKYLDKVTINTSAKDGYTLSGVVVTGATSGNEITVTDNVFTMPDEDVTITATFIAGGYAITVVSPNGTTTCPTTATVGQTVSFTVAPNEGYTVNTVTASFVNNNGGTSDVAVTENNGTYSFGMPPFPVTVTVTYTKQSSGGEGEWTLVTDASQLVAGNEYIIVSRTAKIVDGSDAITNVALKVDTENNYQDATDNIELSDDNLTATPGEDVTIFTLSGQEGAWKLGFESSYLYLSSNDNRLFFGAPSTESNSKATITIDETKNYKAFIVFNDYAGSTSSPRYIQQYNNNNSGTRSARFSTYTSAQEPVYLYTHDNNVLPVITLRELCQNGVPGTGDECTIADDLQVVYVSGNSVWVKDANGQSIYMSNPAEGDKNFEVPSATGNTRPEQKDYDQSNWCELQFDELPEGISELPIIKGRTLHGKLQNRINPCLINVTVDADYIKEAVSSYAPNFYMAVNFTGSQKGYFFMNPKPQECADIVWAIYDSSNKTMIMPSNSTQNSNGFEGSFKVNMSLNENADVQLIDGVSTGKGYQHFKAIIRFKPLTAGMLKAAPSGYEYEVYPLDIKKTDVPTAINGVSINGEVKSVKYVNVAGIMSDTPFEGVNIVVTEYTDGSRTTSKMLRK